MELSDERTEYLHPVGDWCLDGPKPTFRWRDDSIPGYRGCPGGDEAGRFWNPEKPPCVPSDHRPTHIFTSREAAEAAGSASIQLDGYFIDYPIVYKSQRILALADKLENG